MLKVVRPLLLATWNLEEASQPYTYIRVDSPHMIVTLSKFHMNNINIKATIVSTPSYQKKYLFVFL